MFDEYLTVCTTKIFHMQYHSNKLQNFNKLSIIHITTYYYTRRPHLTHQPKSISSQIVPMLSQSYKRYYMDSNWINSNCQQEICRFHAGTHSISTAKCNWVPEWSGYTQTKIGNNWAQTLLTIQFLNTGQNSSTHLQKLSRMLNSSWSFHFDQPILLCLYLIK